MNFFKIIFFIFLSFAFGAMFAQDEKTESEDSENSELPSLSAAAEKALGNLPFSNIPGDDIRPSERRKLVKEISQSFKEYAQIIEAMAERLKEVGYEDTDKLLAEDFAFLVKKLSIAQQDSTPSTPVIETPKQAAPAAAAQSRASRASRKKEEPKNEMPVVGEDGSTFDAKEGILTVSYSGGGGATAFLAEINGKPFIVTNLHVATGGEMTFNTVHGTKIETPNTGFAAIGKDLYIMPIPSVPDDVKLLPVMESLAGEVKDGDEAMVCGNAQGLGVLVVSHGKILAIGPDRLETDCAIFKGNSGSPMYHNGSKKIIGVVSHFWMIKDEYSTAARARGNSPIKSDKRDFGMRIDAVKTWSPLSPAEAVSQFAEIDAYAKKIRYAAAYWNKGFSSVPQSDFPEASRVVSRSSSMMNHRKSSFSELEKTIARDMLNELSRITNNEIARIKMRKFNDAFKPNVDSLIDAFTSLKEAFANEAKSIR